MQREICCISFMTFTCPVYLGPQESTLRRRVRVHDTFGCICNGGEFVCISLFQTLPLLPKCCQVSRLTSTMRCLNLCRMFSVRASPAALRDRCPKCAILMAALRQANKLATSGAECVPEVRNSHSCATPSKQTNRIRCGIRIRSAQFA